MRGHLTPAGLAMFSYPKSIRLRRRLEFRQALDGGRKLVHPELVVFTYERAEAAGPTGPRLGLIASKKVGPAVARNRVKRHLREAFRQLRPRLVGSGLFAHTDIVVIARATAATSQQLQVNLERCLSRIEGKKRRQDLNSTRRHNNHGSNIPRL